MWKIVKIAGNLITVICLIFIINRVIATDGILQRFEHITTFILLIVFSLLFFLSVLLSAFAWEMILKLFSKSKFDHIEIIEIYLKSNIAKYLPGNFMHYLGRNIIGRKFGLNDSDVAMSSAFEIFFLITSGVIYTAFFSFRKLDFIFQYIFANNRSLFLIFLLIIIFIIVLLYLGGMCVRHKIAEYSKIIFSLRFISTGIKVMTIYIISFSMTSIILFSLLRYILQISIGYTYFATIMSAYIISWVVGFLIPGSPGGIGVRESVLIILLSGTIGHDNIIVASIFLRLITIIGDIIAFMIALIIDFTKRRIGNSTLF